MRKMLRSRWQFLAVLVAVVTSGMVMLCLFATKMRERKVFVVAPVDGYRYRCTLSVGWKPRQRYTFNSPGLVNNYQFAPTTSPVREWIAIHLFRQPPGKGRLPVMTPEIVMQTHKAKFPSNSVRMKSGYPEPNWQGMLAKILAERHFRIDGCPATALRWETTTGSLGVCGTALLVFQPENGNTYIVAGTADFQNRDRAASEMEEIIASFRVEKVAPVDSKR